jgi:hypothetical protein
MSLLSINEETAEKQQQQQQSALTVDDVVASTSEGEESSDCNSSSSDSEHINIVTTTTTTTTAVTIGSHDVRETNHNIMDDTAVTIKNDSNNNNPYLAPRDREALKPFIGSTTVLSVGFVLYLGAILWPPILIVLTYILSKLLPYCFLWNDDAVRRRKLWRIMEIQAKREEDGTNTTYTNFNKERRKNLFPDPKQVTLEEKYWVNER